MRLSQKAEKKLAELSLEMNIPREEALLKAVALLSTLWPWINDHPGASIAVLDGGDRTLARLRDAKRALKET